MIDLPNTSWMWIPDWEKADHSVCYLVYFRKKILLEKIPESLKLQMNIMKNHNEILWIYHKTPPCFAERRCTKKIDFILSFCLRQEELSQFFCHRFYCKDKKLPILFPER